MSRNCVQKTLVALFAASTLIVSGCSSSSFLKTSSALLKAPVDFVSGKSRQKSVAKILCLWEAAEGQGLDEKPSRGFAGQVMFFEYGNPTPVQIAGDVVIYQYKDYDPEAEEHTLLHTFRFDAGAWQAHRTQGTLGDSYNVFLPFTEKHKDRVTCALRVEMTLENGSKISSPYTEVNLAGKKVRISDAQRNAFIRNRQIGGKSVTTAPTPKLSAQQSLDTLTIELPKDR
ncbi:MAG: hypothetical protein ABJZ55_19165 [Fuerstiella sp.]